MFIGTRGTSTLSSHRELVEAEGWLSPTEISHDTRQQVCSQRHSPQCVIARGLLMPLWCLDVEPSSPLPAANTVLASGMSLNGQRTGQRCSFCSFSRMLRSDPMQVSP